MAGLLAGGNQPGAQWLSYVVILLVLVLVVVRQMRARRVTGRRLLVVPGVLIVWGISELGPQLKHGLRSADVTLLVLGLLAAVAFGALRGATVRVWERDGISYQRARWITLAVWVASIAARWGLDVLAHDMGATVAASGSTMPVLLGVTLLAQNLLVAARMQSKGLPRVSPPTEDVAWTPRR